MSDETAPETDATATEPEALPADHPLVKTLAEQKRVIRELKAKAQKLDEIEDAQKSETEKAAERIRQLEQDAADARREALRFKVAAKFGVGDEDADLFLTGSDEETLTKQAERLAARSDERKQHGNVVPREGNNPNPGEGSDAAFVRSLFSPDG